MQARVTEPDEIASLREAYRAEMDCQIIHDSIHARPGWTIEYALEAGGALCGYGSMAIAGPWRDTPTLYEFYVSPACRNRMFDLFETLLRVSGAKAIETQTNDLMLTTMMHTFATNIEPEAILFEDAVQTAHAPPGTAFREAADGDIEVLKAQELDDEAGWVVTLEGEIAGAGGILYHYNRPYGDLYMKTAEAHRNRGLGAYLVQELKNACRKGGSVPAARCNIKNLASRKTLQKAGFAPCGHLIGGRIGGI